MADDPNELVLIEHPQVPESKDAPGQVRRSAFEALWKDKGWKIQSKNKEK
jgi:hypothetical protein